MELVKAAYGFTKAKLQWRKCRLELLSDVNTLRENAGAVLHPHQEDRDLPRSEQAARIKLVKEGNTQDSEQ